MKTIQRFFIVLLAGLFAAGLIVDQGLAADKGQNQESKKLSATKKMNRATHTDKSAVSGGNDTDKSAATGGNDTTGAQIHRDGSAYAKESRINQADRQAAAKRAKEKGFEANMVEISTVPAVTTETDMGAKK